MCGYHRSWILLTTSEVDRSRVAEGFEHSERQVWLSLTRMVLSTLTFISFRQSKAFLVSFCPRARAANSASTWCPSLEREFIEVELEYK